MKSAVFYIRPEQKGMKPFKVETKVPNHFNFKNNVYKDELLIEWGAIPCRLNVKNIISYIIKKGE